MTPAEFNALPLEQQKQNTEIGDVVVTDTGAQLAVTSRDALIYVAIRKGFCISIPMDAVIRVIRPTPKYQPAKVPEIVPALQQWALAIEPHRGNRCKVSALYDLLKLLADHFEREAGR